MTLQSEHLIQEIRDNIRARDVIKARLILDHLTEVDEDIQVWILFELSRAEDDFAIPLLARMYQMGEKLQLPKEQIREVLDKKIEEFPFALLEVIQDQAIVDKTEYIRMAGEVQCNNSVPIILNLLNTSKDDVFNAICIEALGKIGNPKVINDISDYLYSGKRELTIRAIEALTNIGTPEAVERLSERMGTDTDFDRMIMQSFVKVKDHKSLQELNKLLVSHDAYQRNFAIDNLIEIGKISIPVLIDNLSSKHSDLLIHSLNILGNIGDADAIQPIRTLLFNEPQNANVRFAAYEALGRLPLQKGAYVLTAGLTDSESQVHIAAAKSLERNLDSTVIAGIKNMLRGSETEQQNIVQAFINAEADESFKSLFELDSFKTNAMKYLTSSAHPDLKDHFAVLLNEMNLKKEAEQLGVKLKVENVKKNPLIFAIDDSRMILKIYKSTLHQLDYPAQLFEFPEAALEEILKNKPGIVITDLNMPVMNGIGLTKEIRKNYSREELPILMVTTQQDLQDREAAFAAGINGIVYKPFSKETLQTELEKVTLN